MQKIIIATHNKGKLLELQTLMTPLQCIAQSTLNIPAIEETGLSFVENAILKARHVSHFAHAPALADDSGLEVSALQGRPGIYSARFAAPDATDAENIERLLTELRDVPNEERQARFYCAMVLMQHANDPSPVIATGYCEGLIARAPSGEHGFGYDSIFYVPEYGCTFAELSLEMKNAISHRAKALTQLRQYLKNTAGLNSQCSQRRDF